MLIFTLPEGPDVVLVAVEHQHFVVATEQVEANRLVLDAAQLVFDGPSEVHLKTCHEVWSDRHVLADDFLGLLTDGNVKLVLEESELGCLQHMLNVCFPWVLVQLDRWCLAFYLCICHDLFNFQTLVPRESVVQVFVGILHSRD